MMGDFQIFLFDYLDLKIMGQSIYIISVLKKPIKKLFLVEKEFLCPSFLLSYTFCPSFSLPPSLHFFPPFPFFHPSLHASVPPSRVQPRMGPGPQHWKCRILTSRPGGNPLGCSRSEHPAGRGLLVPKCTLCFGKTSRLVVFPPHLLPHSSEKETSVLSDQDLTCYLLQGCLYV